MPFPDQLRKKLQEEGQEQQANMHAVDIRIRCDHHPIETEAFNIVLDPKCGLQKGKFLVLINDLFREPKGIKWFPPQ